MSQTETRNHFIKCKYGLPAYRKSYMQKTENPVDDKTYNSVLLDWLTANQRAVYLFGYVFVFPKRMGKIEIRKRKGTVKIANDGSVINKLAVNWAETRKLWKENPKAKADKIRIRYTNEHSGGYIFSIRYIKSRANYKNKSIYHMKVNRTLKRNIEPLIKSGKLDAFLLTPEY